MGLTYHQSGVNYDSLDAFKRACQKEAAGTVAALARLGLSEPADIRGESAYLIETPTEYLAHVEEGLGTKNLVADAMLELTGQSFYENIGIDTVATIVNDLITTGAMPISVAMHAAVGDANWFNAPGRSAKLARGFAKGCRLAQAVWGGGETPALPGIVNEQTIVLAGSAIGRITPKSRRITGDLADGDAIILLASNGVHTNGLSLCRRIASNLPRGYLTPLPDGRTYGQALLDPSIIYVAFVSNCQAAGVHLKYLVHITGHGWRKLMRPAEPWVYRITQPGKIPALFDFIQKSGPVDIAEAFATFNMGAGFAAYVSAVDVPACLQAAAAANIPAWVAGDIHKQGDRKAVEIAPLNIVYEAESLQVR